MILILKNKLVERGINVEVLSSSGGDFNIHRFLSTSSGFYGLIPFWEQAARYIIKKANKFDALWMHAPIFLNNYNFDGINTLISFHTTYNGFYEAYRKQGYLFLMAYYELAKTIERHMFKSLNKNNTLQVTAVSPSVAEEISANGLCYSPKVIYNGIEINKNCSMSKQTAREYLNSKYLQNFLKNDFILLYIGRITEQKRPFEMLNYFKKIKAINPNTRLIICGKGNLLYKLKEKAKFEQKVTILGYVSSEDLNIMMKASDAFLSLSCYEGFPLAVLEAAAQGLPLILSDIPPHVQVIRSKIGTGVILSEKYEVPEPKKILEHINELKSSAEVNINKVIQNFSWDAITNQYLKLLFP